jgi:hypothetical protein
MDAVVLTVAINEETNGSKAVRKTGLLEILGYYSIIGTPTTQLLESTVIATRSIIVQL